MGGTIETSLYETEVSSSRSILFYSTIRAHDVTDGLETTLELVNRARYCITSPFP